jgi:hypothetical protein
MDTRNELLLAAMRRAGRPLASGDVLDSAVGLALGEGWMPEQVRLSRKAVSKRLQHLVLEGSVITAGETMDDASRRLTPLYAPVNGDYDLRAPVPAPPTMDVPVKRSPHDDLDRAQLLVVLDVQDDLLAAFGRQLQDMQRFFVELTQTREKCRGRLLAAGLGDR